MIVGIFGTGRNGSSLISRLLDGLEDSYVHPVEESFASAFNELARGRRVGRLVIQNCTTKPLKQLMGSVPSWALRSFYAPSIETLHQAYIQRCAQTRHISRPDIAAVLPRSEYGFSELIEDYLGVLAKHVRPDLPTRHFVFKTIETPYIADYAGVIKGMRFIHIIRDPIAVCASQKRSLLENKKLPGHYLGYDWLTCMMSKRWVPHARFITAHQSDPAHILVRYEDLVTSPHAEMARIADWLKLAPPPRPDRQTVFADLEMETWGFNPSKQGVETPVKVVANLQEINQYGEILTNREIDLINSDAAAYRKALGYPEYPYPPRTRLFIQHLLPDKWETMHCKGIRPWLRALGGIVYRRFHIVVS